MFKKAITVLGSVALVGMTVGIASAASSFPQPFTSNTAIVVGSNAAPSDSIAASSVASNLNAASAGSSVAATLNGATGVSEDQIALGGKITDGNSRIKSVLKDNKIKSLLDTKINWDDGSSSGAKDYNVHEEILVGNTSIKTTLDDNDFTGLAAMTEPDHTLEYKYVFDDALNTSAVGTADADDLYLTILGTQYKIDKMSSTSVTVVTSKEVALSVGESTTVDGKTFTVNDVFSGSVQVNGQIISSGSTKRIDGVKVNVDTIGYNSNSPELSKVILKIGKDITKTYTSGEAYIGQNENDPTWVWDISNLGSVNGFVGVKYNRKQTRAKDDVVYAGGSYMFPDSFAEVQFNGLTNTSYSDFNIGFDNSVDLWNSTDLTSTANTQDAPVLIISSTDGTKDAIQLTTSAQQDTSKIYLRWAKTGSETQGDAVLHGSLEVFYSDVNGIVQDAIKPRFAEAFNSTTTNNDTATITSQHIADITVGDTIVAVNVSVTAGDLKVTFTDNGAKKPFSVDVGGDVLLNQTGGNLKWFGTDSKTTSEGVAESTDLEVGSTTIGTKDNDVMTYDGVILKTPKSNLEGDNVVFSVPSDQVYAKVSVLAGGTPASDNTTEAGVMTVMDNKVSSVSGKNLIVIGGSAINSVAADLLGSAYRGPAFTAATGVASGEFLIQSFDRSGQTALLVAGYNAADTEKAVTYLLNNNVDTTVGTKLKGTSATEATVVTA